MHNAGSKLTDTGPFIFEMLKLDIWIVSGVPPESLSANFINRIPSPGRHEPVNLAEALATNYLRRACGVVLRHLYRPPLGPVSLHILSRTDPQFRVFAELQKQTLEVRRR